MLVCVLSRPFQWTCKSCMASHVLVGDCILVLLEKQHVFGCICGLFMLASVGYLRLPLGWQRTMKRPWLARILHPQFWLYQSKRKIARNK